MKTFWGIF